MNDMRITRALIGQVTKAAAGDTEQNVKTIITRPLWRRFNEELGHDPETKPTDWLGIHETHRVYGSQTEVIESEESFAISYKPE